MKKISFLFICIFLMLFLFSCIFYDSDPETTEKILIENLTNETVEIYYYDYLDFESRLTKVNSKDTKFVYVALKVKYYARGESTKKDYGYRTFVEVPSNFEVKQTWVIIDE